jgi:uncharacterized protein (TIGR00369 family)
MGEHRNSLKANADQLMAFMAHVFPGSETFFQIDSLDEEKIILRGRPAERHLRPGGTISGPTLMLMADTAMYLVLLARIGLVPGAVTTNLNIHFLRKAALGDLLAEGRLLKCGTRLAVGDVAIRTAEEGLLVAQASVTYAIPSD